MQLTEHDQYKIFDLADKEGRVYVSVHGQPGSNSWTLRCPHPSATPVPYIIAHGNPEGQIRAFLASLADAFNRHAESQ